MQKFSLPNRIKNSYKVNNKNNQTIDPIKKFAKMAFNQPILSAEEEIKLIQSYQKNNDLSAYNKLVLTHLKLVVKSAYKYYKHANGNLFDLFQQGTLGILIAIKNFDLKKNVRFATYAKFRIQAYILNYLKDNYSVLKIIHGRVEQRIFFSLFKLREEMIKNGENPDDFKRLSRLLNADEKIVEDLNSRINKKTVSLNQQITNDSKDTLIDNLHDKGTNLENQFINKDLNENLQKVLQHFSNRLNENQKTIWEKRLLSDRPLSLYKIGDILQISRERVRQIEKDLKNKLKSFLERQKDFCVYDYIQ